MDAADPPDPLFTEPISSGPAFTIAIADLNEHVGETMADAATAYRKLLADRGFADGAADLMTIDYHRAVLAAVLAPAR